MWSEVVFLIIIWTLFGAMITVQIYLASRFSQIRLHLYSGSEEIKATFWRFNLLLVIVVVIEIALAVTYSISPAWYGLLYVFLPDWLRWLGIVFGIASFAFFVLSELVLVKNNVLPWLFLKAGPPFSLGIYSRVRYPAYTAYLAFIIGIALVAENLLFVLIAILLSVVLIVRIPKEEQKMIQELGQEYKSYLQRTGMLFPK